MKRALIVGINYTGTGNDLRGCINDANNMKALFESRGFTDIKMILEKEATTANMKAGLEWLVAGTAPGDTIVFHYSGHGSQIPSKAEPDGFEEILCPIDLNWTTRVIRDVDLHKVFNKAPNGCNTTLILDCCHSGTALNQTETMADEDSREIAAEVTANADERYMAPPDAIQEQLEGTELVEWSTSRDVNASALLVACCRANQTSADAFIDGTYQGAGTASILKIVKGTPKVTYKTLVRRMNDFMVRGGYTQRPQLDGFNGLYDETFAEPFGTADNAAPPAGPVAPSTTPSAPSIAEPAVPFIEPVEPATVLPPEAPLTTFDDEDDAAEPKKDHTVLYIILAVIAIGLIVFLA